MTDAHQRLTTSEAVISADLGTETLLLDAESGMYYGLTEVSARIWEILDTEKQRGVTESEIIQTLLDEFDVTPEQLQRDVERFIRLLVEKGLTRQIAP